MSYSRVEYLRSRVEYRLSASYLSLPVLLMLLFVSMTRIRLLNPRVGTFSSLVLINVCLITIMLIWVNKCVRVNLLLWVKWRRLLEISLVLCLLIVLYWWLICLRLCRGREWVEFR